MSRRLVVTAACAAGATLAAPAAAAPPQRATVLVGGPEGDPTSARLHEELGALGFETRDGGSLHACSREAISRAARDAGATAVACTTTVETTVWTLHGSTLRFLDVVRAPEETEARETAAVRAAEVVRASIALADPPAETTAAAGPAPLVLGQWEALDRPAAPPSLAPPARRAPRFGASVGASALAGVDAIAGAVSAQALVGITKDVALAARLDFPVTGPDLVEPTALVRILPGLGGLGAEVPLATTTSRLVPRLGAGLGVVWLRATIREGTSFDASGNFSPGTGETVFSPAAYGTAGLSLRVVGPVRAVVDGLFGATASRIVTRHRGADIAYWGQPFGALALRVEVMVP